MGLHKLAGVPKGPELRYRGLRRGSMCGPQKSSLSLLGHIRSLKKQTLTLGSLEHDCRI